MEPIRGKVARILNSRDLVINRGANHGVDVGMRFMVIDTSGENITDPDTGEVIGSLQKPKVEVEVTQVGSQIAMAHTFKYRSVNVGGTGLGFAAGDIARMFAPRKYVREYETLKSADQDWEPLSESESYVEVGDSVVQVIVEDEDDESPGGVISSDEQPSIESPKGED
jgi:hypothetical protein